MGVVLSKLFLGESGKCSPTNAFKQWWELFTQVGHNSKYGNHLGLIDLHIIYLPDTIHDDANSKLSKNANYKTMICFISNNIPHVKLW